MNGLLNNSSSVNLFHCQTLWKLTLSEENVSVKQLVKMVIVMVVHYFHSVLEHGLPPLLKLEHITYSTLPRIHVRRETWHAAQRNISLLPELSECTVNECTISSSFTDSILIFFSG